MDGPFEMKYPHKVFNTYLIIPLYLHNQFWIRPLVIRVAIIYYLSYEY